jgi:hypothetical protein
MLTEASNCSAPAGICPADQIVCVVVDEAHRATGKYDIVTALNKVMFLIIWKVQQNHSSGVPCRSAVWRSLSD